jgi:hypothetical protein
MTTYATSSIQEAVELAARFREEGRYDLFRGQRKDWPLKSSLARQSEADRNKAEERIELFFSWVESCPELKEFSDREDQRTVDNKYAVAQHYGLATTFCDFTTDPSVAGFFASSDVGADSAGRSVIICCNSREFIQWCRTHLDPDMAHPELLRLSIPNLWRIEAQRGAFLFLPYEDFETMYRLDRIEFPAGKYVGVDFDQIYPQRRSQLEVLLDQYFRFEMEQEGHAALLSHSAYLFISSAPDATRMMRSCLIHGDPGPHVTWIEAQQSWSSYTHQSWRPVRETIPVDTGANFKLCASEVRETVFERMSSVLSANLLVRTEASSLVSIDADYSGVINKLQLLWDGLRSLPYSDKDLAIAMSNGAFLAASLLHCFRTGEESESWRHVAGMLLEQAQMVEFGRIGNASAAGYADEDALLKALRPDFAELLKPEYVKQADRGGTVIQVVQIPSRAFVFEKFASVFATQVAPTQVMLFASKGHYFNPFRLERFGLP